MNNVSKGFNDTVSLKELEYFHKSRQEKNLHPDRKSRVQSMQMDVGNVRNNIVIDDADALFVSVDQNSLDLRPAKGSALIDAGAVAEGFTDGYKGDAPDIGAYEYGGEYWFPGADWLPDGLSVPKTMAEANRLAIHLRKNTVLRPREKKRRNGAYEYE